MKIGTFYEEVYDYMMANHKADFRRCGIEVTYIHRKQMQKDEELEILISGTLRASEMSLMPSLKAVMVPFTGFESIDTEALVARGIRVFNTNAHAHFVAERALALVLAVMGRVVFFHNELNKGMWVGRMDDDDNTWSSIYGRRIGIYGYGAIGSEICRLLKPFGGEHGTLRYKNREYDGMVMFDELEALAEWCDILIISVPLSNETKERIDRSLLDILRDKTLINIARGAIIKEDDLYHAIVGRRLAGYGSDVWYTYPTHEALECAPSKYPFETFDNVVMTPHNAGFEKTSRSVRYEDVYRQIQEVCRDDYSSAKY